MKERPIIFSSPMVRSILDGRKTQTRRVVKLRGGHEQELIGTRGKFDAAFSEDIDSGVNCPYGLPGDRLWVREKWTGTFHLENFHIAYAADGSERFADAPPGYVLPKSALKPDNWVTPLFMPRWSSRITLEITDVRVQRIQEISEQDSLSEGAELDSDGFPLGHPPLDDGYDTATEWFSDLWDSINAKRGFGWESNPWVWAITFQKVN